MKATKKVAVVVVLAIIVLAGIGVYAASNYGSEEDPLITKSYLDQVLQPQLEKELDEAIDQAKEGLYSTIPSEFSEVKLKSGQAIICGIGGELVLCSGNARGIGSIIDTTTGSSLSNDSPLTENHLYLTGDADSGLVALGNVIALVSGNYMLK